MEEKPRATDYNTTDERKPCGPSSSVTMPQDPTLLVVALTTGVLFGAVMVTLFNQVMQAKR